MDTKAYLYRREAIKRWTLLFIISLFSMFVLGTYAIAAERYYDDSGRYMGRMNDSGSPKTEECTIKAEDIKAAFKTTTKNSAKMRSSGALFFYPQVLGLHD